MCNAIGAAGLVRRTSGATGQRQAASAALSSLGRHDVHASGAEQLSLFIPVFQRLRTYPDQGSLQNREGGLDSDAILLSRVRHLVCDLQTVPDVVSSTVHFSERIANACRTRHKQPKCI
jgi:hypothetical protein